MPFSRPSLRDLIARVQTDVETAVEGLSARLRRRFSRAMSLAVAGMAHGLHGHIEYISRELMLQGDTSGEGVTFWARLLGLVKKSATQATGSISVTSTAPANISIGDQWQIPGGGVVVEATENVAFTDAGGETLQVSVEAVGAGLDGNLAESTIVSLVSPITNILSDATVFGADMGGGANEETDAEFLQRLLLRTATAPLGGGPGDYVNWALEVSGVTRAWEIPEADGPGTVLVLIVNDNEDPIDPGAQLISDVEAYFDAEAPVVIGSRADGPDRKSVV